MRIFVAVELEQHTKDHLYSIQKHDMNLAVHPGNFTQGRKIFLSDT